MVKHFLLMVGFLFSIQVMSQTGIGTSTPNASAKLDVYSDNKGFLPPRVILTSTTDNTTVLNAAEGLLVYNKGSVGLQAGYYYWNGVNWATIATGTNAGNAVVAGDLVKLYAEAWSNASNKIGNSNGYSFTVPVSGRYVFDFSSTTYGSTSFTINFYVRQGTTNLASDGQVSTNNGVRVEYNGKFEVNLQAGTTYNVYVTSTNPNRGSEDYDRVYYKMVAGNLPVNQHMADRNIQLNNNYLSNDGGDEGIRVDNSGNVGIGTTTPGDLLVVGSSIALHDGGDKLVGMGWSPGSGKAILEGYPAEIRLNPSTGKLSLGTDPTSRSIGSSAGVQRRLTITSVGNVGIGTENPGATLEIGSSNGSVAGNLILNPSSTGTGVEGAQIDFRPAPVTTSPAAQIWVIDQASNANNPRLRFFPVTSGETYGFAIKDNGYLGIGTGTPSNKLHVQSSDATSVYIESTTSDNNGMLILNANTNLNWSTNWHEFVYFRNQGSTIGSIGASNGGNMVSYNTSSDYRLKTDLNNYNGLDLVNKIKTYDFAWRKDRSRMFGVMAHELQAILPYAVNGQKDAVDENGKIIPQSVDYSKLTPLLVKAIQEQDVKIKELQLQIQVLLKRLEIVESKK